MQQELYITKHLVSAKKDQLIREVQSRLCADEFTTLVANIKDDLLNNSYKAYITSIVDDIEQSILNHPDLAINTHEIEISYLIKDEKFDIRFYDTDFEWE
jgi:hypothetical protein